MRTFSSHTLSAAACQARRASYITTSIAGRFVNPAKLESFLDERFNDNYTVETPWGFIIPLVVLELRRVSIKYRTGTPKRLAHPVDLEITVPKDMGEGGSEDLNGPIRKRKLLLDHHRGRELVRPTVGSGVTNGCDNEGSSDSRV
ncbi:hypothetical protein AUP68_03739 [Ilyonectria robusta]